MHYQWPPGWMISRRMYETKHVSSCRDGDVGMTMVGPSLVVIMPRKFTYIVLDYRAVELTQIAIHRSALFGSRKEVILSTSIYILFH